MHWQTGLEFMISALGRMRVRASRMIIGDMPDILDEGLRTWLGMRADYTDVVRYVTGRFKPRTIYKVQDRFRCCYVCFLLPTEGPDELMVIGPYLSGDISRDEITELQAELAVIPERLNLLKEYFASLPVYGDVTAIMAMATALGEQMWGADGFGVEDMKFELEPVLPQEQSDTMELMRRMEERYAYENEMLEIVSKGLTHRAEGFLASISKLNFTQRAADPLRNLKNYCIICNTLMRKAAEQGGVHPLHLDRMSGSYARKIETAQNIDAGFALLGDMLRSYSRLVRTHAMRQYSAIIQKVMTYIEVNLAGDLNLHTLAGVQQVSKEYLSALFRRETGRTLTEHITERRMKAALSLLTGTRLQVQAIAQLCGFSDPNYFGKQFKKFYGATPANYRKTYVGRTFSDEG